MPQYTVTLTSPDAAKARLRAALRLLGFDVVRIEEVAPCNGAVTPLLLPAEPDGGFGDFWQAYPRRVGRADAERAWKKLGCASILPQILTSIRKCKISQDWTKDAGQFIPHPATWLNRRGWEDELQPRNGGGIQEHLTPHIE